jgi:hypothetical protein
MCVLFISTNFVRNISHSKKNWARYDKRNVRNIGLHVMYPLFLSDFNETWIFQTDFREIHKYQILLKSVKWEPSYFICKDRRTDMKKLIVAFFNFAKAPNKNRETDKTL